MCPAAPVTVTWTGGFAMARDLTAPRSFGVAGTASDAGLRRQNPEQQLARLGELGDALGRAGGDRAVVGVGQTHETPEAPLDVVALDDHHRVEPEDLHRPPALGGHVA